jgi:hypothetical protein
VVTMKERLDDVAFRCLRARPPFPKTTKAANQHRVLSSIGIDNMAAPAPAPANPLIRPYHGVSLSADAAIPALFRYAHLYMPLITFVILAFNGAKIANLTNPGQDQAWKTVLAMTSCGIPTYLVASFIYPSNRPDPTPTENVRFTRKNDLYRALVLATYGRLYGTPFNVMFFIADFALSYPIGMAIGERPTGTPQRRSEFFVAMLWVVGSMLLQFAVPASMTTLRFWIMAADRCIWRAAYLALMDDVVGVLARPDVRTTRGKVVLVLVQSSVIVTLLTLLLQWSKHYGVAQAAAATAVAAAPKS